MTPSCRQGERATKKEEIGGYASVPRYCLSCVAKIQELLFDSLEVSDPYVQGTNELHAVVDATRSSIDARRIPLSRSRLFARKRWTRIGPNRNVREGDVEPTNPTEKSEKWFVVSCPYLSVVLNIESAFALLFRKRTAGKSVHRFSSVRPFRFTTRDRRITFTWIAICSGPYPAMFTAVMDDSHHLSQSSHPSRRLRFW